MAQTPQKSCPRDEVWLPADVRAWTCREWEVRILVLLLRVHSANELDSLLVSWFNECCILKCTPSEKFLKVVSVWIYPTGAVDLNALKLETN